MKSSISETFYVVAFVKLLVYRRQGRSDPPRSFILWHYNKCDDMREPFPNRVRLSHSNVLAAPQALGRMPRTTFYPCWHHVARHQILCSPRDGPGSSLVSGSI